MSNRSKFLPVLALAVALTPFAASARSDRGPVQDPTQQQFLMGGYSTSQAAPGRSAAATQSASQLIAISAAQFAAINAVPEEN